MDTFTLREWERDAMQAKGIKPISFNAALAERAAFVQSIHGGDSSAASMRDGEQCQCSEGVSQPLALGSGCASSAERQAAGRVA